MEIADLSKRGRVYDFLKTLSDLFVRRRSYRMFAAILLYSSRMANTALFSGFLCCVHANKYTPFRLLVYPWQVVNVLNL